MKVGVILRNKVFIPTLSGKRINIWCFLLAAHSSKPLCSTCKDLKRIIIFPILTVGFDSSAQRPSLHIRGSLQVLFSFCIQCRLWIKNIYRERETRDEITRHPKQSKTRLLLLFFCSPSRIECFRIGASSCSALLPDEVSPQKNFPFSCLQDLQVRLLL